MRDVVIKSKKALVFFGSPHESGYTAELTNKFLSEISRDYEYEILKAYEQNIKPCIGCGICDSEFTCRYKDFCYIDNLIKHSSLIIVASPIYNLSFPAPLKLIFDRMQPYFAERVVRGEIRNPMNKMGIMLLTCGTNCSEGAKIIKRQLQLIFSTINTQFAGQILWKNTDNEKNFKMSRSLIIEIKKLVYKIKNRENIT
ncbi:MAG: flavodoxin family protein [Oscillospiraceae bacterium]|nr:flavodoxin family protein [Oscillospiraceae bacterium]